MEKCLHTALLVSDLERAEYFYSHVLGLTKVERELKFPGVWYQIGEFQIHLIVDANFKPRLANQDKWGRNPHIAFAVKNLQLVRESLAGYGSTIQFSSSGRAALFVQDPDGNVIEVSEITHGVTR